MKNIFKDLKALYCDGKKIQEIHHDGFMLEKITEIENSVSEKITEIDKLNESAQSGEGTALEKDLIEACWLLLPNLRGDLFLASDLIPIPMLVHYWGVLPNTNEILGGNSKSKRAVVHNSIDACYILAGDYLLRGKYFKARTMMMCAGILSGKNKDRQCMLCILHEYVLSL